MAITGAPVHENQGSGLGDKMRDDASFQLDAVIDTLVEAAPQLIRQRQLLLAIDWSKVGAQTVRRLLERLADANMVLPAWLARSILNAGHALPESTATMLAPELQLLRQLNEAGTSHANAQTLDRTCELAIMAPPSGETAAAIVRRLVEIGAGNEACTVALAAWPVAPRALHLARDALSHRLQTLPGLKCAVAGFSTTSTFAKALVPAFAKRGIRIEPDEAPFGSAIAALHAPAGDAQASLLLLDAQSLIQTSWRLGLESVASDFAARLEALKQAVAVYSAESALPLIVNTLPAASVPILGHMDGYHQAGMAALTRRANAALAELAAQFANVVLVDADVALSRVAHGERSDPRLWFYGRIAYAEAAANELAEAFAAAWAMRTAKPLKVVALDFDNTLWGGVFGDDGMERLQCGDDPPGNAFKALQEECLRLKAQGKLLAGLSKNNPDALAVFERHPGMALRVDDFAATAVNWQPKADNIRTIAADLNLGLDSFIFLDDSPHEREAMRRLCPEVRVPEMPADPAVRPLWLRGLIETWPTRLTTEDMQRPAMYSAERKARELRAAASSYDDYLQGLDQRLTIESLTLRTLPRVAQLHERTNQFNPTTRRYSEADLTAFMDNPETFLTLLGAAEDRFGQHGIVIAAVARIDGRTAHIESLVMSCRVIARQVETAFLGALIEALCSRGVSDVVATYRPTAKNALVRDLYATHGFQPLETGDKESSVWIWKAKDQQIPASPFVAVEWSR
ncbi:MAG: HAD-IIIC family phosphatase [Hyphomicrobiaceae bacterium]|nr:HAD-IIIC family phosphatase [Hyphomicrobiaceae bacterium]